MVPGSTISPRFKQCLVLTPFGYYFPRTSYNNNLQQECSILSFTIQMEIFNFSNEIVVHSFHYKSLRRPFYTKSKDKGDSIIFSPYLGGKWSSHILLIEI